MSDITSFEILEQEIKNTKGKPRVLQALWDGDTHGWYLILSLYAENPSISNDLVWHYLGRVETDGRQTKAELAKTLGEKAIGTYGLEFYFPSPDDADDDCPDWKERHLAQACAGCGKLILKDRDTVLPREICYHCYLERERNRDLIEDKLQEYGVTDYACIGRKYECMSSRGYMKDFAVYPYISDALRQQIGQEGVSVFTIEKDELLNLSKNMEARLDVLAKSYKPAPPHERSGKAISMFRDQSYKGNPYRLDSYRDPVHDEMAGLLYVYNKSLELIQNKGCFKYFIKGKGYSYRDDAFMRFLRFKGKGRATVDRFHEHYKTLLSREQVLHTLHKLERFGCITLKDGLVSMTHLGKHML